MLEPACRNRHNVRRSADRSAEAKQAARALAMRKRQPIGPGDGVACPGAAERWRKGGDSKRSGAALVSSRLRRWRAAGTTGRDAAAPRRQQQPNASGEVVSAWATSFRRQWRRPGFSGFSIAQGFRAASRLNETQPSEVETAPPPLARAGRDFARPHRP